MLGRLAATALILPLLVQNARARPYVQLEIGTLPRTEINAEAGEHFKADTKIGYAQAQSIVGGQDWGSWRLQLALSHRFFDTDGLLDASFQTNGSLRLWSGVMELLRDVDLRERAGLPLQVFAGAGVGAALADLHDFGRGNGSEVVPVGTVQLGAAWSFTDRLELVGGGRLIATGTFDSPGEEAGEPKTFGRLAAPELFLGLRANF